MGAKVSMEQLSRYLSEQIDKIQRLGKEVEEIQVGFNSRYVDFKTKHDATLASLSEKVERQYNAIDPVFRESIEERRAAERKALQQRRVNLGEVDIPTARKTADQKQAEARAVERARQKRNPMMDMKEERAKGRLAKLVSELESLNTEIGRLRRGLGFLTRYPRIVKLDRQRNRIIGEVEATRKEINELRLEWKQTTEQEQTEQSRLAGEWREMSLKAAKLQDELDYLNDDGLRESLALRRAIAYVLDEMKDPGACKKGALCDEVQEMIRLNIQTDNYQEGLGTVSGFIALLRGVTKGFESFKSSVDAIINEQKLHSAHLSKPTAELPDVVTQFCAQWDPLRQKLKDEGRLAKFPLEFIAAVRPALDQSLTEKNIEATFKALEGALRQATARWRG